ncbi:MULTISPECIES: UvrD-helicase domain-containing protein [Peptoniphilaceae]|uniref:UvrD-helicase domain-containing protein n=2 Tax=Peptoniphilaceae TaxID=1570339 RepID=A0ABY4TLH5_9FIRM|nr:MULTISPECIES: UvrD-helicase domain-containing protein [Peptoniphilaceae]MCW6678104.1 UvrD-helicase domain-containing protein [Anaerococcus sp. NML200574]URN41313.1 UvrD-helicase domain-containing protein [Peptoniphilus sp. SAHP1]
MDTLTLEKEVLEALECIKNGENFILEGGAGSGKTYSLISLINALTEELPDIKIVCITYTNNAVAEILSRIENENIWVSTIHEFIWSLIRKYQNEIKNILVELINDDNEKNFKKPKDFSEDLISQEYFENLYVDYDEYYSVTANEENRVKISHNHILIVAEKMFEKYKKIADILKDIADCIFVDEYQDTSPLVADILLKHLEQSDKKNVIGFFGDSMQSIYDDGVGNLNQYNLTKIVKTQNRRNPRVVIEVANKFRDDDIEQRPSEDINAPNMENGTIREGSIKFLYGTEINDFISVKGKNIFESWDFSDGKQTKELRLTHKYNAEMTGFKDLYDLYNADLITKLISGIKKKIDKGNLDCNKTLGEITLEVKPTYNKVELLDQINGNEIYQSIYSVLEDMSWEEAYEKCRITKESLMSYKLNGMSGRYEANSYRDRILRRLDILEEIIELYEANRFNDFLRITKFSIHNRNDKICLKQAIDYLVSEDNQTIENVLKFAEVKGLLKEDELFSDYISNKGFYLWERIKKITFNQYRKSVLYLKEFSPICTQHSVKGSEYDNVLLVLESDWNKYDFRTLFGKGSPNSNVQKRTKKLFYVCITRAKKNLIIYMPTDDSDILEKAKEYFGEENVIELSSI